MGVLSLKVLLNSWNSSCRNVSCLSIVERGSQEALYFILLTQPFHRGCPGRPLCGPPPSLPTRVFF